MLSQGLDVESLGSLSNRQITVQLSQLHFCGLNHAEDFLALSSDLVNRVLLVINSDGWCSHDDLLSKAKIVIIRTNFGLA